MHYLFAEPVNVRPPSEASVSVHEIEGMSLCARVCVCVCACTGGWVWMCMLVSIHCLTEV